MDAKTIEVLKVIGEVCEEEGIKVAVKESIKGGILTGATATISGLLMGPVGLFAGATLGGLVAYYNSSNYSSVPAVINSMDQSKKEILANKMMVVLRKIPILKCATNAPGLLKILAQNAFLKSFVFQLIFSVLSSMGVYLATKTFKSIRVSKGSLSLPSIPEQTSCLPNNSNESLHSLNNTGLHTLTNSEEPLHSALPSYMEESLVPPANDSNTPLPLESI